MRKFLPVACILVALVGCQASVPTQTGKIKIVATTGMVADLAEKIGGEHVEVTALMGPGVDPHLYKASPGDVSLLNQADIVLYSGLHLEGKMADIFERLEKKRPVYAVTPALPKAKLLESENFQGFPDPHVWFDVDLWSQTLMPLAEFLAKQDPAHGDTYRKNAETYKKELDEVHAWAQKEMVKVPEKQRILITAHDAFRYFGRAYRMRVMGIQGISTESEAGLKEINRLVDVIVQNKVKAVFVESSVSEKNIQALVEGAKKREADVKIGGSLFSDAMGGKSTPEGTYPGMIRHNVRAMVSALK